MSDKEKKKSLKNYHSSFYSSLIVSFILVVLIGVMGIYDILSNIIISKIGYNLILSSYIILCIIISLILVIKHHKTSVQKNIAISMIEMECFCEVDELKTKKMKEQKANEKQMKVTKREKKSHNWFHTSIIWFLTKELILGFIAFSCFYCIKDYLSDNTALTGLIIVGAICTIAFIYNIVTKLKTKRIEGKDDKYGE